MLKAVLWGRNHDDFPFYRCHAKFLKEQGYSRDLANGEEYKSLKLNRSLSSVAAVTIAQGDTGQNLESNAAWNQMQSGIKCSHDPSGLSIGGASTDRTGAVPAFRIHIPVFTCSPGTHSPLKPREPLRPTLQNTVTAYTGSRGGLGVRFVSVRAG